MEQSHPQLDLPALFDKALAIGGQTHTREDILAGLKDGKLQCWSTDDSIVITEVIKYPRKKILHAWIVAGDFATIMAHLPAIQKFAEDNGCSAITTTGRRGFLRRLPEFGFKPKLVMFELPLESDAA